jgi:hypothetical protein
MTNIWVRAFFVISAVCITPVLLGQDTTCRQQDFGKIDFKKNSSKLTTTGKYKLDSLVAIINSQPGCIVLTSSFSADFCDKCGALSWDRQNEIVSYLARKGVGENRLTSYTQLTGNTDFVTLTFSSWSVVNQLVNHPNLKQSH